MSMTTQIQFEAAAADDAPLLALPKLGLLVLRRQRPGFDPQWGKQMEDAARGRLKALGGDIVEPAVGVVDDPTLRAAIATFSAEACGAVIVLQPNMGDVRLIPTLAQQWDGAIVLWATPERLDTDRVSSCSLVGAHAAAALLRQFQRPFEIAYSDPRDAGQTQLEQSIRIATAAAQLCRSKIGLVGQHAPGFINMHVDPATLMQQLGVHLHHIGLAEMMTLMQSLDAADVERDVQQALALPIDRGEVTDEQLAVDSRFYLATRRLMDDLTLDAIAVRCWPEMPNQIGQWPYLAMARLTTEGRVIALEGDADGATTGLMLKLLGLGPGYISDWLEHSGRNITLWHPGHAPLWLTQLDGSGRGPRLGRHFNTNHPIVIDAALKPDYPITLCRLWRCDGQYRMTAMEAHTRPMNRPLSGATALAELVDRDADDWFQQLCHAGMPHHITVVEGHQAKLLSRLARHLNLPWGP